MNSWSEQWCSAPPPPPPPGTVLLWELIRLRSTLEGITIYKENSSCRNHKSTKRDKQQFRFLYNKTFLGYCLYLITKEIPQMHRVQKILHKIHSFRSDREGKGKMSMTCLDGIRETTTDLCYRHIDFAVCFLNLVDKIIWIRKDSISIYWFRSDQQDSTSRFRSVQCLSDRSNVSSLWTLKNVCLSLPAASDWLLISSKVEYKQFLATPMNYNM